MYPTHLYPTINLLIASLEAKGYRHEKLLEVDGQSFSRFTAPSGNCWVTHGSRITYPFVSSSAKEISKDKSLAYALAESAGITIPFTRTVTGTDDLDSLWDDIGSYAPVVVKPSGSTLSRGLTMNIMNKKSLTAAIIEARQFPGVAMVQQQVDGTEIRFAVLDGKCTAAIIRLKPSLTGDGRKTVRELLAIENKEREKLKFDHIAYPQLDERIIDMQSLDMDRVLADGEELQLGDGSMIRRGASFYNVIDSVHESYKHAVEKLADSIGRGFMAVDVLVKDHTAPLAADNYAFLEFNMAPNLLVFYGCRDGKHYDILNELVPMIDKAVQGAES
jgi:cyanophycin synthetase